MRYDMNYEIIIKRGTPENDKGYEHFLIDADKGATVLRVLEQLNLRTPLCTKDGAVTEKIGWECSCKQAMCGACAMNINGRPMLACKAFLKDLKNPIMLEPFRKFPLVRDLIVDKSVLHEHMMDMKLWISGGQNQSADARMASGEVNETLYQSAACIQCGCCLEACPNYTGLDRFYGAMMMNTEYQIINQEPERGEAKKDLKEAKKHFAGGCSNSFACEEVCPVHVPLTSHISKLNALAWRIHFQKENGGRG
ncbi:MAG: 2Fe-2S iron-sulfur cluster-binding protein [bacterium]|nr:2Fe-2S iron-sulfur cluster-binding protein [bacterium]